MDIRQITIPLKSLMSGDKFITEVYRDNTQNVKLLRSGYVANDNTLFILYRHGLKPETEVVVERMG